MFLNATISMSKESGLSLTALVGLVAGAVQRTQLLTPETRGLKQVQGTFVNRFRFLGDSLGYCVGSRAYRYSLDSTSTVVEPTGDPVVLEYSIAPELPQSIQSDHHNPILAP